MVLEVERILKLKLQINPQTRVSDFLVTHKCWAAKTKYLNLKSGRKKDGMKCNKRVSITLFYQSDEFNTLILQLSHLHPSPPRNNYFYFIDFMFDINCRIL